MLLFLVLVERGVVAGTEAGSSATPGDYNVQRWQLEDGLPRNSITALGQTSDGYLWLGTPYGVVRFDGVSFTAFESETMPVFGHGVTRQLVCDARGRLWIGSGGGLVQYDGKRFYLMRAPDGTPFPTIDALAELTAGVVAAVTFEGRVVRADEKMSVSDELVAENRNRWLYHLVQTVEGRTWFAKADRYGQIIDGKLCNVRQAPTGPVQIAAGRQGGLWWTSGPELRRFKPGQAEGEKEPVTLAFRSMGVNVLHEDRQGILWLGTERDGLFAYTQGRLRLICPLPNRIEAIWDDPEHNLWVGTDGGGLLRLRPRSFQLWGTEQGLADNRVLSICCPAEGSVWAVPGGGGLERIDPDGRVATVPSFERFNLASVLPSSDGRLWVGSVGNGLFRVSATQREVFLPELGAANLQVRLLLRDRRSHLWVGAFPYGLFRLPENQPEAAEDFSHRGVTNYPVTALAEDAAGVVWVGTASGALYYLDGERFVPLASATESPHRAISALHATPDGSLWIGTLGQGLGRCRQGAFRFVSRRDGLYDDVITRILEDHSGFFWLGSSRGLFRVPKADLEAFADRRLPTVTSSVYGRSDGLENAECGEGYQPAVWKTAAGELWFATRKGLVRVKPDSLPTNRRPPPLALEQILVDGRPAPQQAGLEIPPGFNQLEFGYTALSFAAPEKVRFRRQLQGFDPDWVEAGPARSAVYPRLGPGRYTFRFCACNNDGIWNETPCAFSFVIRPTLWQTGWFQALTLLGFGAAVAGMARWVSLVRMRQELRRLERERTVERERARIARDLHDDLGGRLTQMSLLGDLAAAGTAPERTPAAAFQQLANQAREATRALDQAVWMINPAKDTLAHLVEYISQYANGFFRDSPISCLQEIPTELPTRPLRAEYRHHLFLAVKEALTNVQRHSRATEVWVRIHLHGSTLEIAVEDNGEGAAIPDRQTDRNGLKNMQERLGAIGGHCSYSLGPQSGWRVCFSISLP